MTTIDPKFGQELRRLREAKGISQRKLGKIVGLGSGYISRIERGEFKPPSESKIVAIADALEANKDHLLSLSGKIASDVTETILNQPTMISDLVRSLSEKTDKVDGSGKAGLILMVLFMFSDSTDIQRKNELATMMFELAQNSGDLPLEREKLLIRYTREFLNNWEDGLAK